MTTQNYANHIRFMPLFHFVLLPVMLLTLIGSIVNLVESIGDHQRLYSAALIVVLSAALIVLCFLSRIFALTAQDRAIRAEENLRHLSLTGKLLDPRLGIRQVIALRFAPDAEFPALANRAAEGNLAPNAIKQAVKIWRVDTHRV